MYALIENNAVKQYPYGADVLRRDNPQTSFPRNPTTELLAGFDVFPVKPTEQPAYDQMTQKLVEGTPVSHDGVYKQVWKIVALSDEEQKERLVDLQNQIVSNTQERLDSFARTRAYDNILSACTYATSSVQKFANEGQYCVNLRDSTWAKLYEILEEVNNGTRPIPSSFQDVEKDLPILKWPE